MKTPAMILFDYGHTLVYESPENFLAGAQRVLELAKENPLEITAEALQKRGAEWFREQEHLLRPNDLEVMGLQLDNTLYAHSGLTFDLTPWEVQYERWVAAETIVPMEGIGELLAFLHDRHIRTGVISNLSRSGKVLKRRIDAVLPQNHFECVVASSDYLYRKPRRELFELAIRQAGIPPERVWFCGDDIVADVEGAHAAGLFPVWYDSQRDCVYKPRPNRLPVCPHIHIREWRELISLLS